MKPRARHFAQAFVSGPLFPAAPGLTSAPAEPPSPRALTAHGLRQVARWLIPVETLEKMAELRAAPDPTQDGRNRRLSDAALAELGWTAAEAGQIVAALKTERARRPDEPGRPPRPPKDSPFAALAGLNTTAPPRRRRPRKRAKPG